MSVGPRYWFTSNPHYTSHSHQQQYNTCSYYSLCPQVLSSCSQANLIIPRTVIISSRIPVSIIHYVRRSAVVVQKQTSLYLAQSLLVEYLFLSFTVSVGLQQWFTSKPHYTSHSHYQQQNTCVYHSLCPYRSVRRQRFSFWPEQGIS